MDTNRTQIRFPRRSVTSLRRDVRPEVRQWAKDLRQNPAPGEAELWERLRGKSLGFRFRRQAILHGWIADFWCPAKRLVVEVDGASHGSKQSRIRDWGRDKTLSEKLGISTRRFRVEMVLSKLDEVVEQIRAEVESRPTCYLSFAPWLRDRSYPDLRGDRAADSSVSTQQRKMSRPSSQNDKD